MVSKTHNKCGGHANFLLQIAQETFGIVNLPQCVTVWTCPLRTLHISGSSVRVRPHAPDAARMHCDQGQAPPCCRQVPHKVAGDVTEGAWPWPQCIHAASEARGLTLSHHFSSLRYALTSLKCTVYSSRRIYK